MANLGERPSLRARSQRNGGSKERRAGQHEASRSKRRWIERLDAKQQRTKRRHQRGRDDQASRDTDGHGNEAKPEHKPGEARRILRTERDSQPDFTCALPYGMAQHAVDADGCEQERDRC